MTTAERIADAAALEFAERGVHGVRMEHVARRAGVNKALVYRHFGDKETLYAETLRRELAKRRTLLDSLPESLEEMLVFWSRQQRADADFIRLVVREGLQDDGNPPVESDARAAYYERQVDMLRRMQEEGRLRDDLEPRALFFALLTLTVAPVVLPQILRLVMPEEERDGVWEEFVSGLGRVLGAPGPGARESGPPTSKSS